MDPDLQYGSGYAAPNPYQQPEPNNIRRIVIFVGAGFIGLLILLAGYLLLFTGPSIKSDIVSVAAVHSEISRISDLGLDSDRARRDTKNIAANTRIVSLNNQSDIARYIDSNFTNAITNTELSSAANNSIDSALEEASNLNNYDVRFIEIMGTLIDQANQEIVRVFELTDDQELRDILNDIGTKNQLLLTSLES